MDLTSKVNRLLAEFAGRIGLPSLSLDEEGMASLLFDEQVGVTLLLLAERERLLLEADVAGIDVLGEGIFRQLASFNRHWHRFDLHFGFDELTGKVQLYAQILAAQLTLDASRRPWPICSITPSSGSACCRATVIARRSLRSA